MCFALLQEIEYGKGNRTIFNYRQYRNYILIAFLFIDVIWVLKSKFGERSFSYAGPAAWNSLPEYIQMDLNINRFKKLLKTYLFASSFLLFI